MGKGGRRLVVGGGIEEEIGRVGENQDINQDLKDM